MKPTMITAYLIFLAFIVTLPGCSGETEKTPPPPANIKAVTDYLNGKKLRVDRVGFYGSVLQNTERKIEWLDTLKEKNDMVKSAAGEEMSLGLYFQNDTAVVIFKKNKQFTGVYSVDDSPGEGENEQDGIKIRISYADPDFGFGDLPTVVTYTYRVIGLDDARILLETPRTINRQKLISLMRGQVNQ